jgi:hypothetical protein
VTPRHRGYAVLVALAVAAAALITFELAAGALGFGERLARDPCTARPGVPGRGVDPTLQRIVLDGLDGAACKLGTTREELVLSFDEDSRADVPWTREALEDALRAGLLEAIDRAEERGGIGSLEARLLEEVVRRAPIEWLIDGGEALRALLDR